MSLWKRSVPAFYPAVSAPSPPTRRVRPSEPLSGSRKKALWIFTLAALLLGGLLFPKGFFFYSPPSGKHLSPSAAKTVADDYVRKMGGDPARYSVKTTLTFNETLLPLLSLSSFSASRILHFTADEAPPLTAWETVYRTENDRVAYSVTLSPGGSLLRVTDVFTHNRTGASPLTEEEALQRSREILASSRSLPNPSDLRLVAFEPNRINPAETSIEFTENLSPGVPLEQRILFSFNGPTVSRLAQEILLPDSPVKGDTPPLFGKTIRLYKQGALSLLLALVSIPLILKHVFAWRSAGPVAALAFGCGLAQLVDPRDFSDILGTLLYPTLLGFLLGGTSLGLLRRAFRRHHAQTSVPRLLPYCQHSLSDTFTLAFGFFALFFFCCSAASVSLGSGALLNIPVSLYSSLFPSLAYFLTPVSESLLLTLGIMVCGALYLVAQKQSRLGACCLIVSLGFLFTPFLSHNPASELSFPAQALLIVAFSAATFGFVRLAFCNPLPLFLGCLAASLAVLIPYPPLSLGLAVTTLLEGLLWVAAVVACRLLFRIPAQEASLHASPAPAA